MTTGVLAVQGDFEKHVTCFSRLGLVAKEIRTVSDLESVARLIIPGGESTTVGLLLQRYGLAEAINLKAKVGMPIWGTCMGMILLAKSIEERPEQFSLGLLDIKVKRNYFGAQIHSFEDSVGMAGFDTPVLGVFIRAPIVTEHGPDVEVLATYKQKVVAVRQGNIWGTSFHPELTDDLRMHEAFLKLKA